MYKLFPKQLLGLAVASVTALGSIVAAEADTWRMAFKAPLDSPDGKIFQKFAELVDNYTDGELTIELFPSEQLGQAQASLEQLSGGVIQIYAEDASYLNKWSPAITWTGAPFLFKDRDHLLRFLQTDYMDSLVAEAEKAAGVTVLGDVGPVLRGPYRVLLTKDPVNGLADVDGLKLRIWDNELVVDVWSALGAEVRVLGWTDVYQSIQTGVVEAVTSPVSLIEAMKFTEVAPYVARTDEFSQSISFMTNKAALDGLSEEHREAILKAYYEAGEYSHVIVNEITDAALERLKAKGVEFVALDTGPFVERVSEVYAERAASGDLPAEFLAAVEATR